MNAPRSAASLPDIQSGSPDIPLSINSVGIKALRVRVQVPDNDEGLQNTIATCSLEIALSAAKRGAHMSRFIEVLNRWNGVLKKDTVRTLLQDLLLSLDSTSAMAFFNFPFFMSKTSPSGMTADIAYECGLKARLAGESLNLSLSMEIPVMTVCPCSKAICDTGAHSQRALVRLKLEMDDFIDFARFIDIVESSGSSGVYTLLKREDEKLITEKAFANPAFVEDVARKTAFLLAREKNILAFNVEVESMESIHNHNAFASISWPTGGKNPDP